jgi:Fic family protein
MNQRKDHRMPEEIALYTSPQAMEPLLPESSQAELAQLTCEILLHTGKLSGQVPSAITRHRITLLVRTMNSYYSNLIEGHKTLPRDIERAQRQDYSADPVKRENQLLTQAHIEVEEAMVERLRSEPALSIHSRDFLGWLQGEFYRRLPYELHFGKDHSGRPYRIEPGAVRSFEVDVGRHQPPHSEALPAFLARFEAFYGSAVLPTHQLVAMAAAHHRLAWIHPFGDGNGRVARLYSHACLVRQKVDGLGLWTLSRGFARLRREYFERLHAADQKRRNDFDGRGNLSDRALGDFCLFFLRTTLDQIGFMAGLLELGGLCQRIERHLIFERLHLQSRIRERLVRLLKATVINGEVARGSVPDLIGARETVARETIRIALAEGLVDSPTPKGPLSIVFSAQTLDSYFPQLFQDLPIAPMA